MSGQAKTFLKFLANNCDSYHVVASRLKFKMSLACLQLKSQFV